MISRERLRSKFSDQFEIVVTDDGSRTLYSVEDEETFHSESGAFSEAFLVYLKNSGAKSRLEKQEKTRILELGFGTGLNFLLSANCALKSGGVLEYVSIESRLLPAGLLQELQFAHRCTDKAFYESWMNWYLSINFGEKTNRFEYRHVTLKLLNSKVSEVDVAQLGQFNCVYFDPFSPDTNPDVWNFDLFNRIRKQTMPGGKLVTYCVKSAIRKTLTDTGFTIEKTPGPRLGKREVLVATNSDKN